MFGIFQGEKLLASEMYWELEMNYYGRMLEVVGLGSGIVDMLARKKGLTPLLVREALSKSTMEGRHLVLLYPFRPDFFTGLGFGYGAEVHQYRIKPTQFCKLEPMTDLRHLRDGDESIVKSFLARYAASRHGFCQRTDGEILVLFRRFADKNRLIGLFQRGELVGYMAFDAKNSGANPYENELIVRELLCRDDSVLREAYSYLNTLSNQYSSVQLTTIDPSFFYALEDVRAINRNLICPIYHESHTSGIGLLYRVSSVNGLLESSTHRDFNGVSIDVTMRVHDELLPQNDATFGLTFRNGALVDITQSAHGVRLELNVGDFASLMMGCVDIATLHRHGRAALDTKWIGRLNQLFSQPTVPECVTVF